MRRFGAASRRPGGSGSPHRRQFEKVIRIMIRRDNPSRNGGVTASTRPDRPKALRVKPANIPAALKEIPQWVVWRYVWSDGKAKWDKPPMSARTGRAASSTDPATWCDFDTAMSAYKRGQWDGIGIVLTKELGLVGIDLDKCCDSTTTEAWAVTIISRAGSYTERSPSGTGIRIICRGRKPAGRCRKDRVEMYDSGRYLTITGHHRPRAPVNILKRPKAIARLHAYLFPAPAPAAVGNGKPETNGKPGLNDMALIAKAKSASNGEKFSRLWAGDPTGYASHSEADLALAGSLAFWAGGDRGRIDSLFRQSGLMRSKWERANYRNSVIDKALSNRTEFYDPDREPSFPAASRNGKVSAAEPNANGTPLAVMTQLSSVSPRAVKWLWEFYIPRGAVTILDGDPGLGKSTITTDLAARVSRGWDMPPSSSRHQRRHPASVLILSAEDSLECTIRPRLDAAGADVERVYSLDAIKTGDSERPPILPWDLSLVEQRITEEHIRLVIVDPLMAYLDSNIDAHRDQDVRRCMHNLRLLADGTGTAILVIRHLNKLVGGPALYRGGGSIGITGAVRSALVVGLDPNDRDRHVLAVEKSNLAKKPPSLAYGIDTAGDVSRIAWGGEVDLTADDILEHPKPAGKMKTGEQCAEAIRDLLAGGPMASTELDQQLRELGYSIRAQKDGRKLAGVRAKLEGFGADGRWIVALPEREPGDNG